MWHLGLVLGGTVLLFASSAMASDCTAGDETDCERAELAAEREVLARQRAELAAEREALARQRAALAAERQAAARSARSARSFERAAQLEHRSDTARVAQQQREESVKEREEAARTQKGEAWGQLIGTVAGIALEERQVKKEREWVSSENEAEREWVSREAALDRRADKDEAERDRNRRCQITDSNGKTTWAYGADCIVVR